MLATTPTLQKTGPLGAGRLVLAAGLWLALASAALAGDRTPNWGAAPTPVALTDKTGAQADSAHPLYVAGTVTANAAPSSSSALGIAPVASTASEACHVLKASAGNLYSVSGYVSGAEFILVFDAASAPADGAVTPKVFAYAASAGSFSINYGALPASFATGITVCASSTGPFTKTAASVAAFSGNVQ